MVSGPSVPETERRPLTTAGGKTPVMEVREKRGEKLVITPPVAADMILMKYAFFVLAPRPGVMVAVRASPVLKSPWGSRVASWIYGGEDVSDCIKVGGGGRGGEERTYVPSSFPPAHKNIWYDASSVISGVSPLSLHSISKLVPDIDEPALGDVNSTSASTKVRREARERSSRRIILERSKERV